MKMNDKFYNVNLQKLSSGAMKFLAVLLTSAFLFSCDHMGVEKVVEDIKSEQKARTFVANLGGLNNSGVTGEVTITYMQDGLFQVHTKANGLEPNMVHPQHIHGFGFDMMNPQDAVCPPMSAAGDDGLLTLPDGLPFYGPVLIPLDSELIPLDIQEFPMANANGQLNYLEFAKFQALIHAIDMGTDGVQTMKNLALDKRTIVLHGAFVKDNMIVPAGTEGAEYVATVPVACGEIKEVF